MKHYICQRCGHKWYPRSPKRPRRCPDDNCKSTYWDQPKPEAEPARRPRRKKRSAKT